MSKVAIIGAGLIGRAWALIFARAGWEVEITDTSSSILTELPQRLEDDCAILQSYQLCDSAGEIMDRISLTDSLQNAVVGAAFVQENGPEDCAIKQAIFKELDRYAEPEAILSSSTSAIVASRFTENLTGRSRCLVGHPVNPPHLVPLVELCPAPWTSDATLQCARDIYQSIGQVPITVNHEVEGFVLNRLQGALLAEAFRLVRDGVVSPQDLDQTLKNGLGLRWSFMGPFETIELNAPGGIADYCKRYCSFYESLAADSPGPDVFAEASQAAIVQAWPHSPDPQRLAERTRWRDEELAALRAWKQNKD